tara:strand:+ start:1707 stop:2879 length:1173 start_codon:yes stop_codon:yes gene_type:complete
VFGRFNRSKKAQLTCPNCGHRQEEPALAISSFCRNCGEHFRIEKGIAIANSGLRVSGIAEVTPPGKKRNRLPFQWANQSENPIETKETEVSEDAWLADSESNDGNPQPLPQLEAPENEEAVGISAGAFFGLVDEEEADEAEGDKTSEKSIGEQAQGKESLAEGSMEALIGTQPPSVPLEREKMPPNYVPPEKRKKASDNGSHIEVRCFRCYHNQSVSRYAKSTQCERCSVYISLANYDIISHKSHTLRTRGDITVSRRGGLKKSEIACHHLTVNGSIDATVDCSGDATFRRSGVVRGQLYCRRLQIDKSCEVEFPDGVMVQRAEISGTLKGNLTCSGKVRVGRSGAVQGDIQAIEIVVKDGGSVTGEMITDPETSTELSVKKGTNPSIIG